MWRVLLGLGLLVLIGGGWYVRSRLARSLEELGVAPRRVRAVRALAAWLLWGYPLVQLATTFGLRALGGESLFRYDGPISTWLLVFPFVVAIVVVVQALPWLLVIGATRAAQGLWSRLRGHALSPARWPARARVAIVVGFAVVTPAHILLERGDLTTRSHEIRVARAATPGPAAAALPPFRIAFVSDVQVSAHTGPAEVAKLVGQVNALSADVVLSGGDWINSGAKYIEPAGEAAAMLRSRLGTYSVRGDHEHFAYFDRERSLAEMQRSLTSRGVHLIADEVRWFAHHDKRVAVLFLNHNYRSRAKDRVAALLADAAGADAIVAVTHQLDEGLAAELADRVDLVLAGHTHGGQVRPLVGLWRIPPVRLETPFIDGRYAIGRTPVIVTSGLGYSVVPFRYAAPGTIELVELRW